MENSESLPRSSTSSTELIKAYKKMNILSKVRIHNLPLSCKVKRKNPIKSFVKVTQSLL